MRGGCRTRLVELSLFLGIALSGCDLQPPHVIVTVDDPNGVAVSATRLRIVLDGESDDRALEGKTFPVTVSVGAEEGQHTLVAEALVARNLVARGSGTVELVSGSPKRLTIVLGVPCDNDEGCDNGLFCDGPETCVEGVCTLGEIPCQPSPFECVVVSCLEMINDCSVAVDHNACPPLPIGNGLTEPSYCDTSQGCLRGQPCNVNDDCLDGSICNGDELCVSGRCIQGVPPTVDDQNPCTLDACVEPDGPLNLPDSEVDGRTCATGICVAGACGPTQCGDGYVDPNNNELCEDQNGNPNDGCEQCRPTTWTVAVRSGLGSGQGSPLETYLSGTTHIELDPAGNLYVSDSFNQRVLRLDATAQLVTRAAGGGLIDADDLPATGARLRLPRSVAVDGRSNIFIVDDVDLTIDPLLRSRLRQVDAVSGLMNTIAGGRALEGYFGDGGPALEAAFNHPVGIAVDGIGNLYVSDSDNHRIRRIDAEDGVITTIAGNGTAGFSGDGGPATEAQTQGPAGVAVAPNGTIVFAAAANHRIRAVAPSGVISTIAGTGSPGFSGEGGPGTSAALNTPTDVSISASGEIYIADSQNHRIRKLSASGDSLVTVAGSGTSGAGGDGGDALSAQLDTPTSVVADAQNNLFISDSSNRKIRMVDSQGRISTVMGKGPIAPGLSSDGGAATAALLDAPLGVAVDSSGLLYIADSNNHRIARVDPATNIVTTFAGTGELGLSGDGGPATDARLADPTDVVIASGVLYIADRSNLRVRAVDLSSQTITTVAGNGVDASSGDSGPATQAAIGPPDGLAIDGQGTLYIAVANQHRVRSVTAAGTISTAAGDGTPGFGGDTGAATAANLDGPRAVAVDSSRNLYISDVNNRRIRMVTPGGIISTVAGNGTEGGAGDGGAATASELGTVFGVAVGAQGEIFIADQYESGAPTLARLRSFNVGGTISTVAGGNATAPTGDGGQLAAVKMLSAHGLSSDGQGNLLITDPSANQVRSLSVTGDRATTVAGSVDPIGDGPISVSQLGTPTALVKVSLANRDIFLVADGNTGRVREIDLASGSVRTVVGYPEGSTANDAQARYSRLLRHPKGIAYDSGRQHVYISERDAHGIVRLDLSASPWTVRSAFGRFNDAGHADGPAANAQFESPAGLAFDEQGDRLLVADSGNHCIRSIDLADPTHPVDTIAGLPRQKGFFGEDTDAMLALFDAPEAVAAGPSGSFYIADTKNHRVRFVDADGQITTVVGDGTPASSGEGQPAEFFPVDSPQGLFVDRFNNLFITSRTSVRLVSAGADGIATGADYVSTIYGSPPRAEFPEPVTSCLSGVVVEDGDSDASRLFVLDRCLGFMVELNREQL